MDLKFKRYLIRVLRRAWLAWPSRYEALRRTRVAPAQYKCQICSNLFKAKEMCVDHIDPIIDPAVGFVDWDTLIARLFIAPEGHQGVCKECHKKKTKEENIKRRERMKASKESL